MKHKHFISVIASILAFCTLFCACGKADPEATEGTKNIFANSIQKEDPSLDNEFNLLLVGSSACYYYVEELAGIARAAGITMRVCNLYYSGASVQDHWTWWKNGDTKCEFYVTTEAGRTGVKDVGIMYALQQYNWDAIGMCDGDAAQILKTSPKKAFDTRKKFITEMLELYKKEFPLTPLYWQSSGSYQVGYDDKFKVDSFETQQAQSDILAEYSKLVCDAFDMPLVPRGDAAQLARANPVIGDTITARLGVNNDLGDMRHDGDIGGGQYLTACAWFEALTGQSCIGNTWRPPYALSEEKIAALQEAAHQAVANLSK